MNKKIKERTEKLKSIKEHGKEIRYFLVKDIEGELWQKYQSYGKTEYYKSNLGRYKSHTIYETTFLIIHKEKINKQEFNIPNHYFDISEDRLMKRASQIANGSEEKYEGELKYIFSILYPNEFKDE